MPTTKTLHMFVIGNEPDPSVSTKDLVATVSHVMCRHPSSTPSLAFVGNGPRGPNEEPEAHKLISRWEHAANTPANLSYATFVIPQGNSVRERCMAVKAHLDAKPRTPETIAIIFTSQKPRFRDYMIARALLKSTANECVFEDASPHPGGVRRTAMALLGIALAHVVSKSQF